MSTRRVTEVAMSKDPCNLTLEGKVAHPKDILSCHFTNDATHILTGGSDGILRKIDCVNLRMSLIFRDNIADSEPSPVTSIKFPASMENSCIVTYGHGGVKYWNVNNARCSKIIDEENQTLGCSLNDLQKQFVTLGDDASVRMYDLETGKLIQTFESSHKPEMVDGHKSRVFAAKFHPFNAYEFISGGWDNTIQFWDSRQQRSIRYISGPHICGEGLDIDPTGGKILTCSFQSSDNLRLWDYKTGVMMLDFSIDASKYYCGLFVGKNYVVTGSTDPSTLRIVNMYTNGRTLATYKTPFNGLYSIDFHETAKKGPKKENVLDATIITVAGHMLMKFKVNYKHILATGGP